MLKRNNIEQETVIQKKQKPEDSQEIVLGKINQKKFLLFFLSPSSKYKDY